MFEKYTQDYLLSLMLDKAKEMNLPCTEGSLVYNSSCLTAVMLEDAYDRAEEIYLNAFPDTCDREHLIRFARDKRLEPKQATKAVLKIETDAELFVGAKLVSSDFDYTVIKYDYVKPGTDLYTYEIECETAGAAGNIIPTNLSVVNDVGAYDICNVTEIITYGEDEEETEVLRDRYFESYAIAGQFGNRAYYVNQAKAVPGVGAVKLNVLKESRLITLHIVNDEGRAASSDLIERVKQNTSAAVGQEYSVFLPYERSISFTVTAKLLNSATEQDARAAIEKVIDDYFKQVNLTFGDVDQIKVRAPIIQMNLFAVPFLDDCEVYITSEGESGQYGFTLPENQIAKRGNIYVAFSS